MSAIPVGYEAFHDLRRKGVSLLCLFLASAMAMGIFVYVDSYSVHEWDRVVGNTGPLAMTITGNRIRGYVNDISQIPEVERAAVMRYHSTELRLVNTSMQDNYYYGTYGRIGIIEDSYLSAFPDRFELVSGDFPSNESEIAVSTVLATELELTIGNKLNYTLEWRWENDREYILFTVLTVCGIYKDTSVPQDIYSYYYWDMAKALVMPEALQDISSDEFFEVEISIDVDRSPLTPFNAAGSLDYLLSIEESIRATDPYYNPSESWESRFRINDILAGAVSRFINWKAATRTSQAMRGVSTLLLVALVVFLSVRFNMNERRYENSMLISRGAARSDIERRVLREVGTLTVIGSIVGLAVGVLLSRLALASTGFFEFDSSLFYLEPFLISVESIVLAIIIGILIPIGTWFGYNAFYSTMKKIDESTGKLEKAARLMRIIRWDAVLLILSYVMLFGLSGAGPIIKYIPFLSILTALLPLAIFVSLGSLTIKALRGGSVLVSKGMSKIVGYLPASIGIRRLGKSSSSGGVAILVLVLAISIAWTYSIVDVSMPITKLNQARFAFGGDVAFHLGDNPLPEWSNFTANVTNHEGVAAATTLNLMSALLSAEYYDTITVVGMKPLEYNMVGYDHLGNQLNSSEIANLIEALAQNPNGAIITSDIAEQYGLTIGDTVKAFQVRFYEATEPMPFTVLGIVDALANARLTDTGTPGQTDGGIIYYDVMPPSNYPYYGYGEVGRNTIWVNNEYFGSLVNLSNETENVLCVRTNPGVNGTELVDDLLESGGNLIITEEYMWAAATTEVDRFVNSASYHIDRAVDTMLSIASSGIIFAAFMLYAFEGITARKREIALIRSMGGDGRLIIRTQVAEMFVLILSSLALLLVYGPFHIMNTLRDIPTSNYTFPVSIYPVIPAPTMFLVLLFFVGSALVFIVVVAALSSRIKLAEALNATWAESGPYGGDV